MSNYTVVKNLPIPLESRTRYPLASMLKGDAFTAPLSERNSLQSAARRFEKEYTSHKFVVRKIDSTTVGCWRVE